MSRVKYKKTCVDCKNKEVKNEDIVKGYQYEKGKYVIFTDTLPEQDQEIEVIYFLINNGAYTGYIWTGSEYVKISSENVNDFSELARLDGATFTGDVILAADPIEELGAATKQYVDRVVAAGGSDPAEAIAQAKAEAIEEANTYTNNALTWGTF